MMRRFALFVCLTAASATFAAEVKAGPMPKRVEIDAKKFAFAPSEITLKRGQPVVLVLKSMDVAHGLRIRELNISLKAKAGETAEVTFTPDKNGAFVGICSVFCGEEHGAMTITIHVVA
jgi:cytochrome c oxidase subunit II